MLVRELLEECEKYTNSDLDVIAVFNEKKYPISSIYVDSGILFLLNDSELPLDGRHITAIIESEAREEMWYNWRTGSEFLDLETEVFLGNLEEFYDKEFYSRGIKEIKTTDDEILLICM